MDWSGPRQRSRTLAWLCAGLLVASGGARAAETDLHLKALLEKQARLIDEQGQNEANLRALVEKQARLIEELEKELRKPRRRSDEVLEPIDAPADNAAGASAGKKASDRLPPLDPDAVKKIVADYVKEDRKRDADEKKKKDQEARNREDEDRRKKEDEGTVVGSALGMTARWDHGLWVETADRAFRIHPNGRLQFDVVGATAPRNVEYFQGGMGPFLNAVNFRRARLGVDGTFWEVVSFDLQLDFVNTADVDPTSSTPLITQTNRAINTPVPTDAWLQISQLPVLGNLRGGNLKPPLSLEHLQSSRFLDFLERSYAFDAFVEHGNNGFYPGFVAFDNFLGDNATWAASVYRNTRNIFGWNVDDGDWAGAGRLTWLPHYEADGRTLVHLGLSGMGGDLDQDINRWRARPLIRNGNAVLHNIVALGRVQGDREWQLIPEFAANLGPLSFQAAGGSRKSHCEADGQEKTRYGPV